MSMDWELIVKTLGVSTILVAGVIFLGKVLMGHLLSKDMESFKAELKMSSFEHEIRFSKLHEKVALTIAELYKKLAGTTGALKNYIAEFVPAGSLSEPDRQKIVVDAMNEFIRYYNENKIYFDTSVCTKLDEFILKSTKVLFKFHSKRQGTLTANEWIKIEEEFDENVQNAKLILEGTFREILGVKNENKTMGQKENEQ